MPDEGTGTEEVDAPGAPGGRVPRRFSRKQVRIIGVVAIVGVLVAILLWGMVPEPIYEIDQVMKEPGSYDGKWINLKGVVISWEAGTSFFVLADSDNRNMTIDVTHSGPIPEGFGLNVTAIVKGTFHSGGGVNTMDSEEIQVGCPSKY
jgi:hypothetical protein